jgi:hypothetical protein
MCFPFSSFIIPARSKGAFAKSKGRRKDLMIASGGQGAFFEKTAPWTPEKTFY